MKCQNCGNKGLWILNTVEVEVEAFFTVVSIPVGHPEYNGDGINPDYYNKMTFGKKNIIWASMKEKTRDATEEELNDGFPKKMCPENIYSCKKCGWETNLDPYDICLHE